MQVYAVSIDLVLRLCGGTLHFADGRLHRFPSGGSRGVVLRLLRGYVVQRGVRRFRRRFHRGYPFGGIRVRIGEQRIQRGGFLARDGLCVVELALFRFELLLIGVPRLLGVHVRL